MKRLQLEEMEGVNGGAKPDIAAGAVCGAAIGAAVVMGTFTGGIGFIAMMGGAAGPVCGFAWASLYYGN